MTDWITKWFDVDEEEVIKGATEVNTTGASGKVYGYNPGISEDQLIELDNAIENSGISSLEELAKMITREEGKGWVKPTEEENRQYSRLLSTQAAVSGPQLGVPFQFSKENPFATYHPGTYEEFYSRETKEPPKLFGFGPPSKKEEFRNAEIARLFKSEFPDGLPANVKGDPKLLKSIQDQITFDVDSNLDMSYDNSVRAKYLQSLKPILESLRTLNSGADVDSTIALIKNKSIPKKVPPVIDKNKVTKKINKKIETSIVSDATPDSTKVNPVPAEVDTTRFFKYFDKLNAKNKLNLVEEDEDLKGVFEAWKKQNN